MCKNALALVKTITLVDVLVKINVILCLEISAQFSMVYVD